jgi:amino acid adenylation domain-containing protein
VVTMTTSHVSNQIMSVLSGPDVAYPHVCAHQLFESQVARTPDAIAVVFNERRLRYGDLNERANRLARSLRRRGVGPDVLVGVCLNRTPDLVVALLAVWKAGGAFVPLDPAYPQERLAFMLNDSGAHLLLTEDACVSLFALPTDKAICLDSGWPTLALEDGSNPAPLAEPRHLAYVMYTSGSTGQPKGAMIVHSGLVNYLCWAASAYDVGNGSAAPVHTSISFDLTVTSLLVPMMAGGSVELLPEDVGAQNLLSALFRTGNRSVVKITPAHLELLNQQVTRQQAVGMCRTFVIGGEALLAENLQLWRDLSPAPRLINEYGPTETVVGCCTYEVGDDDPNSGAVLIGRPIANTQLYVLDEDMRPVANGEMGELYIGGAGVARGYLNRPELTAARFLSDPFRPAAGAQIYRTGDLARCCPTGVLEYLGRTDDQVKVRGYRIELGEIEAAMAAHPHVQSCAVLAREDQAGYKQLVGYLVADATTPCADDLKTFLAARLPEYMVPLHYVILAALPLTRNGKVDRANLPPPPVEPCRLVKGRMPQTATEKAVAALWRELLATETIGVDDDLFDLGGHSMTATVLVARLNTNFGIKLRLASLFEQPTIAGLSEVIDLLMLTQTKPASSDGREEFVL